MARIAGVDLPRDKRVEIALTYIFGIGRTTSQTRLQSCQGPVQDKENLETSLRAEDVFYPIDN